MAMIVQHNMSAMNANRTLGITSRAQAKSTEKLSSGYRINRAADDAAGLSISEKMRSQIRGLQQASTNAQDGISLIQTAEGALNESHAILQRMRELSVQAANGTETDDDREAVNDEIAQLQEELTRISTDTEFNSMKLLDGSLGSGSSVKGMKVNTSVSDAALAEGALKTQVPSKGEYKNVGAITADSGKAAGDTTSLTINYLDEKGEGRSLTISLKYKDTKTLVSEDGTEYTATPTAASVAEKSAAFLAELKKSALAEHFDISASGADGKDFDFTAKKAGTEAASITSTSQSSTTAAGVTTHVQAVSTTATAPQDAYQSITEDIGAYDGATDSNIEDNIFEVNGQKFAYVTADGEAALKGMKEYSDVNYVVADTIDNDAANSMANLINSKTGINASTDATADTTVNLHPEKAISGSGGKGMTLQIGANEGQTMTFNLENMSAKALGVDGNKVDLSTQDGAKKATTTIDNAIKSVSQARGRMGAIQNRLEHTIANLDTAAENTQTAESRIRDVDMAAEMVEYSKNNILTQAGQSMLAQANQSTQGVLSLLG